MYIVYVTVVCSSSVNDLPGFTYQDIGSLEQILVIRYRIDFLKVSKIYSKYKGGKSLLRKNCRVFFLLFSNHLQFVAVVFPVPESANCNGQDDSSTDPINCC